LVSHELAGTATSSKRRSVSRTTQRSSESRSSAYLCRYWGETQTYINDLLACLKGRPWDVLDDVRLIALSLAADEVLRHDNHALLAPILNAVEDLDPVVRGAALEALERVVYREKRVRIPAEKLTDGQRAELVRRSEALLASHHRRT
jgi:hypothetical protein